MFLEPSLHASIFLKCLLFVFHWNPSPQPPHHIYVKICSSELKPNTHIQLAWRFTFEWKCEQFHISIIILHLFTWKWWSTWVSVSGWAAIICDVRRISPYQTSFWHLPEDKRLSCCSSRKTHECTSVLLWDVNFLHLCNMTEQGA